MERRDQREEKREKSKLNKYNKNMKQLRMEMRSSLYDRTSKGPHTHEYGEETYNEADDTYSHTCEECGFVETYEKMWKRLRFVVFLHSIQEMWGVLEIAPVDPIKQITHQFNSFVHYFCYYR